MNLYLLRQIHNQREVLQRRFINRPHRVEHKVRRRQQRKQKYARVVVLLLVEGTDSLRINDQALE